MKPFLYAFALLMSIVSFSDAHAQLTIYGGPQLTSASYSINGIKQETEYKAGFMGGVGLQSNIEGPVFFTPMLFFSRKGYKVSYNQRAFPPDSGAVNNNTTINTIELAPLVQVNFSQQASHGFIRFGPSFDFNLSGTEQYDSTNNKTTTRNMVFSFTNYSHATISMNGQLGFQHRSGFVAFAFVNLAVSSLNNADYGPKIFHRVGGIAVGWQLGRKGRERS
jgi:hypothetical protein